MLKWSERQLKTEQKIKDEEVAKRAGEGPTKQEQQQKLAQLNDLKNQNEARAKHEEYRKRQWQDTQLHLKGTRIGETNLTKKQTDELQTQLKAVEDGFMGTNMMNWQTVRQDKDKLQAATNEEEKVKVNMNEEQTKKSKSPVNQLAQYEMDKAGDRTKGWHLKQK